MGGFLVTNERFYIENNTLKDKQKVLKDTNPESLMKFLNQQNNLLLQSTENYRKTLNELIELKEKIATTIGVEVKDCELLIKENEYDEYTQGRLIELHNLLKILL